jgi:flagellar biosynthesis/type III secretory pathway M-ring protein FliF/YscJ
MMTIVALSFIFLVIGIILVFIIVSLVVRALRARAQDKHTPESTASGCATTINEGGNSEKRSHSQSQMQLLRQPV